MHGELASVQGIVDLSPQEALDRAEAFLATQGYVIGQRTYTTVTAHRPAEGEAGEHSGTIRLVASWEEDSFHQNYQKQEGWPL
jgi:hypothetical protein